MDDGQEIDVLVDEIVERVLQRLVPEIQRIIEGTGPSEPEIPKLLTAAELAKHLGISTERVRRKAAQLGGIRIGNRWRFSWAEVLAKGNPSVQSIPTIPAGSVTSYRRKRPPHARRSDGPLLPIRP